MKTKISLYGLKNRKNKNQDSFLFFLLLIYFVDLFLLFDFDCYVDVSLSNGFEEDILLLEYM